MTRRVSRRMLDEGLTALMKAVSVCDLKSAKRLIEAGEDLQARDRHGRNVLYHAFCSTDMTQDVLDMFQLLGEHGIDFNSNLDMDGCSALITAITLNWPIIVRLILDFGADVHDEGMPKFGASLSTDVVLSNAVDGDTSTANRDQDRFVFSKGCSQHVFPLLCAVMLRRQAVVDTLLAAGADCQQTSLGSFWKLANIGACSVCDVRISPIHVAAYHGDAGLLRRLLLTCRQRCLEENSDTSKAIADPSSCDEDITPLWLALLRGERAAVKVLLDFDFPRAPPCHFGSGLQVCLQEGHLDNALMLLRSGYNLWDDLEWIESEQYPTSNTDVIEFIHDCIANPPSLLTCSRNTLRQHMGPRLPAYLATVDIPRKVADVILLKDVLACDEPASAEDVDVKLSL